TVTWINPGGGDWDTPANWSTGAVPGPDDDAVIDIAGITVTHATGANDSAHSVASQASIILSSGSLSFAADSAIHGDLLVTNGTLGGAGSLTMDGVVTWSGGTMMGGNDGHRPHRDVELDGRNGRTERAGAGELRDDHLVGRHPRRR